MSAVSSRGTHPYPAEAAQAAAVDSAGQTVKASGAKHSRDASPGADTGPKKKRKRLPHESCTLSGQYWQQHANFAAAQSPSGSVDHITAAVSGDEIQAAAAAGLGSAPPPLTVAQACAACPRGVAKTLQRWALLPHPLASTSVIQSTSVVALLPHLGSLLQWFSEQSTAVAAAARSVQELRNWLQDHRQQLAGPSTAADHQQLLDQLVAADVQLKEWQQQHQYQQEKQLQQGQQKQQLRQQKQQRSERSQQQQQPERQQQPQHLQQLPLWQWHQMRKVERRKSAPAAAAKTPAVTAAKPPHVAGTPSSNPAELPAGTGTEEGAHAAALVPPQHVQALLAALPSAAVPVPQQQQLQQQQEHQQQQQLLPTSPMAYLQVSPPAAAAGQQLCAAGDTCCLLPSIEGTTQPAADATAVGQGHAAASAAAQAGQSQAAPAAQASADSLQAAPCDDAGWPGDTAAAGTGAAAAAAAGTAGGVAAVAGTAAGQPGPVTHRAGSPTLDILLTGQLPPAAAEDAAGDASLAAVPMPDPWDEQAREECSWAETGQLLPSPQSLTPPAVPAAGPGSSLHEEANTKQQPLVLADSTLQQQLVCGMGASTPGSPLLQEQDRQQESGAMPGASTPGAVRMQEQGRQQESGAMPGASTPGAVRMQEQGRQQESGAMPGASTPGAVRMQEQGRQQDSRAMPGASTLSSPLLQEQDRQQESGAMPGAASTPGAASMQEQDGQQESGAMPGAASTPGAAHMQEQGRQQDSKAMPGASTPGAVRMQEHDRQQKGVVTPGEGAGEVLGPSDPGVSPPALPAAAVSAASGRDQGSAAQPGLPEAVAGHQKSTVEAATVDPNSGTPGMPPVLDPATEATAAAGDAAVAADTEAAAAAAAKAAAAAAAALQQENSAGDGLGIGNGDPAGACAAGSAHSFADLERAFPTSVGVELLWSVAMQMHGPDAQPAEVEVVPVLHEWADVNTVELLRSGIPVMDTTHLEPTLEVLSGLQALLAEPLLQALLSGHQRLNGLSAAVGSLVEDCRRELQDREAAARQHTPYESRKDKGDSNDSGATDSEAGTDVGTAAADDMDVDEVSPYSCSSGRCASEAACGVDAIMEDVIEDVVEGADVQAAAADRAWQGSGDADADTAAVAAAQSGDGAAGNDRGAAESDEDCDSLGDIEYSDVAEQDMQDEAFSDTPAAAAAAQDAVRLFIPRTNYTAEEQAVMHELSISSLMYIHPASQKVGKTRNGWRVRLGKNAYVGHYPDLRTAIRQRDLAVLAIHGRQGVSSPTTATLLPASSYSDEDVKAQAVKLQRRFKDMPDVLALMMRHPSWPDAGAGRQASAAAERAVSAAPPAPPSAALAPPPAASPAARFRQPRKEYTAEEQEVMQELNLTDLTYVCLYIDKRSNGAPSWRVKLVAEGIGFAHVGMYGDLRTAIKERDLAVLAVHGRKEVNPAAPATLLPASSYSDHEVEEAAVKLQQRFKDRPDVLALMMRHTSRPDADATAAEPAGTAPPGPAASAAPAAALPAARFGKPRKEYTAEEQEVMQELNLSDLTYVCFYTNKSNGDASWRVKLAAEGIGFVHVGMYDDLRTAITERDLAVLAVHGRKETNSAAPATLLPASSYSEQEVKETAVKFKQRFKDRPDVLALMMRHPSWPGAGAGRQAAAAAEPAGSAAPPGPAAPAAPAAPSPAARFGRLRTKYTAEEQEVMRELNLSDLTYVCFYVDKRSNGAASWRVNLAAEGTKSAHVGMYGDLRTAIRERDLAVLAVHGRKEANPAAPATLLPASSYSEQEVKEAAVKLQKRFKDRPEVLALMMRHPSWPDVEAGGQAAAAAEPAGIPAPPATAAGSAAASEAAVPGSPSPSPAQAAQQGQQSATPRADSAAAALHAATAGAAAEAEEEAVMRELNISSMPYIVRMTHPSGAVRWRVRLSAEGLGHLYIGLYDDLRTAIKERDLAVLAVHGRKEANPAAPATLLPASSCSEQEVKEAAVKLQQRFQDKPDVLALMSRHPSWLTTGPDSPAAAAAEHDGNAASPRRGLPSAQGPAPGPQTGTPAVAGTAAAQPAAQSGPGRAGAEQGASDSEDEDSFGMMEGSENADDDMQDEVLSAAAQAPASAAAATALRRQRLRPYTAEEQAVMDELGVSSLQNIFRIRKGAVRWRVKLSAEGLLRKSRELSVGSYTDLRKAIRERDLAVLAVHGRRETNPAAPDTLLAASSYSEQEVAATAADIQQRFPDRADVLALMRRHPTWQVTGSGSPAAAADEHVGNAAPAAAAAAQCGPGPAGAEQGPSDSEDEDSLEDMGGSDDAQDDMQDEVLSAAAPAAAATPAPAAAATPAARVGRPYTAEERAVMHELKLSNLSYITPCKLSLNCAMRWRVQFSAEGLHACHIGQYGDLRIAIRERDLAVLAIHGRQDRNPAAPATLLPASSYSEREVAMTAAKLQEQFKDKPDVLALMRRHPSWPTMGLDKPAAAAAGHAAATSGAVAAAAAQPVAQSGPVPAGSEQDPSDSDNEDSLEGSNDAQDDMQDGIVLAAATAAATAAAAAPATAATPATAAPRRRGSRTYTAEEQAVMEELGLSKLANIVRERSPGTVRWRVLLWAEGLKRKTRSLDVGRYKDLRTAIKDRDLAVLAVHGRKERNPAAPKTLLPASSYSEQEVAGTAAKIEKKCKDRADVLALMRRHPSWPGSGGQAAAAAGRAGTAEAAAAAAAAAAPASPDSPQLPSGQAAAPGPAAAAMTVAAVEAAAAGQ